MHCASLLNSVGIYLDMVVDLLSMLDFIRTIGLIMTVLQSLFKHSFTQNI